MICLRRYLLSNLPDITRDKSLEGGGLRTNVEIYKNESNAFNVANGRPDVLNNFHITNN